MSLREADRQKSNCPSRGLGLAAAAIGVGVGAALYCFFSKGPENPDKEGSTSGWTCEQPQAFNLFNEGEESDVSMENQCDTNSSISNSEYTINSETTTTDTSMHDTESGINSSASSEQSDDSYIDVIPSTDEELDVFNIEYFVVNSYSLDSHLDAPEQEWEGWDVTESSLGLPEELFRELPPMRVALNHLGSLLSPRGLRNNRSRVRTYEQEKMDTLRAQTFRERSWSLEECSICFEIMLKDQDLTKLPCAHNFHSSCLAPWLSMRQTCPNCRKASE